MKDIKKSFNFIAAVFFAAVLFSCSFVTSFTETDKDEVNSVVFDRNSIELSVGSMDIINVTVSSTKGQNREAVTWSYDESMISAVTDNYSIIITGISPGTSIIRASCGNKSAQCALTIVAEGEVTKVQNPYVYVSSDYVNIAPGDTEKVYASIYGGTVSDKNGFTFTSDKPGIASVYVEGNYCWITGKSEGLAKITCKHSKCSYGYSFLAAVSSSGLDVPYITTTANILTINKSTEASKSFTVDLKNAAYTTYKDDFTFSVVDADGEIMSEPNVSISASSDRVTVTPLEIGSCYIKVSHPSASYDFNILVRVVENLDAAYIEPSSTYIVLNGSVSETVELSIADLSDDIVVDNDKYDWSFSDNADTYLDYSIYNGTESGKGNSVWLTGKKNGAVKITVSHPLCKSSRTILVLVRNIVSEASSSKVYITTSQNYIETRARDDDTKISININNISSGADDIEWEIESEAADGSGDPVIMYTGGTGTAVSRLYRAAIAMTNGYALIKPLKEGRATITISHPKAAYSTKVLVNVLPENSVSVQPLVLSTLQSFVSIKNGESESLTVSLSGNAKEADDESNIVWNCTDSNFTVLSDGSAAVVTANGAGLNKAILTVSHDKAEYPLNIVLAGYDEAADLDGLNTIYTAQNSYTIYTEEKVNVFVTTSKDDASVTWNVTEGFNETIGFTEYGTSASVTGIQPGTAQITACLSDEPSEKVTFYINVKQDGKIEEDKPCYLTTSYNVVTASVGNTEDISITPVNISSLKYDEIVWTNNNPELFSLASNGENATITAVQEGSGTIGISHPLSNNTLILTVHIGSEYVYSNTDICYISSDDTVTLTADSEEMMFYAVLCHTESSVTQTGGFNFSSSDENIFTVTYASDKNYCYINPEKAGQGILTVSHPDAEYDKEVLVIIQKSAGELADIPYISTTQNVATVIQGEYAMLTVTLQNAENFEASNWTWSSANGNISDIVVNSGSTAMISGVNPGTTRITVSHSDCLYPLEIIVICLDSDSVSANPFIHTSSNIVTLSKGGAASVTADMTGGTVSDEACFVWTIADSSVALISTGSGSCYIKGLKSGQTYITVRNTNYPDAYSKTVFVRVEDTTDDECYISITSKVLKMNPSDINGETVTATLENGEVLDAQDFIWWADDYNIVSISSVTDTCRIVPTGISGTTYVHVKHPKVVAAADILVMCSEYSEFSFKHVSKEILEKSIAFIPMEVPVTSKDSWIEYESSDSSVVVATGSNKVCMIAGIMRGSATVNAYLKTAGGIIATAQMAVIVNKADAVINTISMNSTVINMEIGESRTLEALLSGSSFVSKDYYDLEWSLTANENSCISLLQNKAGKTTGKNSYVTAKASGTAVLTLTHPECIYDLTVWIVVPEKEETDITLTQTYIEMYKADGSATVNAKLINGSGSDASTVTWTAAKVGGVNIISISKSNGLSCNIIPRNVGSTTLRAQLPNGNYADCVVTVLTDAEIVLETKTVHVNPGFTETVNYTVTPENAAINWIEIMNGTSSFGTAEDFFDFSVNESTKVITITGKKLGSGVLYGYSANDSGTAKTQLSVICEYNYELEFDGESGTITMHPDDSGLLTTRNSPHNLAEIPFHVYPKSGMELEITSSDPAIEISSYSFDSSKGTGVIYVKALTEETGGYITLKATNPNDRTNTPVSRRKYIDSKYSSYTINPVFDFGAGSFSRYVANDKNGGCGTLYLGDGESYNFYLDVAEPNAKLSNITVKFNKNTESADTTKGNETCTDNMYDPSDNDSYNDGAGADKPHLYFTGTDDTLEAEFTNQEGMKYYKIGHNYDYTTKGGYLVKGDAYFGHTVTGWYMKKVCTNPHSDHDYKYETRHYIVIDGIKVYVSTDSPYPKVFSNLIKKYLTLKDDCYYYYDKSTFRPCYVNSKKEKELPDGPPYPAGPFYPEKYSWNDDFWFYYDNLPYWFLGCKSNNNYYYFTTNTSCHPGFIGESVSMDSSVKKSSVAYLTISYQDVNQVNSSENNEAIIKICVERRDCPGNINGLWKSQYDSNGKHCWKFNGSTSQMPSFIADQTVCMEAEKTEEYTLNTNLNLNASNTRIISDDSDSSLITLELKNNNVISVTTGEQQTEKYLELKEEYQNDENITPEENPEAFEEIEIPVEVSKTFTIEYYENGTKITSGEITVIYE